MCEYDADFYPIQSTMGMINILPILSIPQSITYFVASACIHGARLWGTLYTIYQYPHTYIIYNNHFM